MSVLNNHFIGGIEARAQFGDMFGAVNALFSGLAFLGIIYTIYLQRNELALQRGELKLTRDELNRSAQAQEKSEEALSRQAESLRVTAKLNGLSSMMQFELAKPGMKEELSQNENLSRFFEADKVEYILKEIQEIVESE